MGNEDRDLVAKSLADLGRVIDALPPAQRRELLPLLVSRREVKPWQGEVTGIANGAIAIAAEMGTRRYSVRISLSESSLLSTKFTNLVDGIQYDGRNLLSGPQDRQCSGTIFLPPSRGDRIILEFHPPLIAPDTDDEEEDAAMLAAALFELLEEKLRMLPEHWHLWHEVKGRMLQGFPPPDDRQTLRRGLELIQVRLPNNEHLARAASRWHEFLQDQTS